MKMSITVDQISALCEFEVGKCYMLMLLPRKKENDKNTEKDKLGLIQRKICLTLQDVQDGLSYFEDFTKRYPEIVFRVYISVDRRDIAKALFCMQDEINSMVKDMYYGNNEVFDRTVNLSSTLKTVLCRPSTRDKSTQRFHFDIDYSNKTQEGQDLCEELLHHLISLTDVYYVGLTLNGFAIVTAPFNPNDLKEFYPNYSPKNMVVVPELVEIKTNSMLYVGVFNYGE